MVTVCEWNQCAGCMACVDICGQGAITVRDDVKAFNAIIDEEKCVRCGACRRVCQYSHPQEGIRPISWFQGWASQESVRQAGSSGGIGTALAIAFLRRGGAVVSCAFRDGRFTFRCAEKEEEASFSGSKYVKSHPLGAFKKVRGLLADGRQVLFIGLPCQAASLRNYCRDHKNLYVVDLICHGSPSPQILEKYFSDHGTRLQDLDGIAFRKKLQFQLSFTRSGMPDHPDAGGSEAGAGKDPRERARPVFSREKQKHWQKISRGKAIDSYLLAFLESVCYTENCYACRYARIERVGDLTLGDSWGSDLPSPEVQKGISLVLCQTEKGRELLAAADLDLRDVDLDRAIAHNRQLSEPSGRPPCRDTFFELFDKNVPVDNILWKLFPRKMLKQEVKKILPPPC